MKNENALVDDDVPTDKAMEPMPSNRDATSRIGLRLEGLFRDWRSLHAQDPCLTMGFQAHRLERFEVFLRRPGHLLAYG